MNSGRISFQTVQRRQIVDDVVEQLQKKISLGELPIGAQIPTEPELMAQFGVGRSTIREAVRVLAHAGLLEKRQGHGTFVIGTMSTQEPLDDRLRRAEVLDVYEVRFMLEVEIARLAAERRDENDLVHIRESLELRNKHLAEGDNKLFLEADIAFHFAVAAATKNPIVVDLYQTFSEVLRVALVRHTADPELHHDYTEQHIKLYEAIRDQDSKAAVTYTVQHLERTKRELEQLIR
ncbi:FadR family transcriptional regulator [Paenibacillus sp. SYP-B3998]|uniref:FadR family transcriptional regulator n=2 Tax=Paenibacillus sp. SYP-B3998 TaxID=2678564 RepID=A0A6G3ZYR1_9BACL|nr:FadR/GntR family transcriptional regulator [Paenibacillus sp. SYP-B3998]NEW06719.1 FadR family transcriptional regulator [Paenibacillus sp. SYP-B3998]